MTAERAARVYAPMAGRKLAVWLLLYLAMILLDVAVIVAVIESV